MTSFSIIETTIDFPEDEQHLTNTRQVNCIILRNEKTNEKVTVLPTFGAATHEIHLRSRTNSKLYSILERYFPIDKFIDG